MVAAGMLAMNNCVCEFAANGREAVEAAKRSRFDLILMDCSMPEMDGYEATAHIRVAEEAEGLRTPLVAMTANTQRGDAEKCMAAGMDDYLAKPITLVELRHKLQKWLPHGADAHSASAAHGTPASAAPPQSHAGQHADAHHLAPIDMEVFEKLREILGAALPHAVSPFLEDSPVYLNELEQAVHTGDSDTARARAHALKGSSGNLGANALALLAQQIEALAIERRLAHIAPLLPALRAEYGSVAAFLSAEMSADDPETDAPQEELASHPQQLRYRNTPAQWTSMVHPGPQGMPGARITAVAFDGRSVELFNEPGRFGLKRMIDAAVRRRKEEGVTTLLMGNCGV
eukprot:gene31944-36065_t